MDAVALPPPAGLPPGPRGSLLDTLTYLRSPHRFFSESARKYGDPFTVKTEGGPLVFTGNPEHVRTIFSADPDILEPFSVRLLSPFFGERSVIMVGGERHRRDRKLLTPPFHGARMRAYGRAIADVTRAQTRAAWVPGWAGPVQPTMSAISLDVIIRAVFGIAEGAASERWSEATRRYIETAHPAIIFFPMLRHRFFGFGPWSRFLQARDRLASLVRDEIAARRARDAYGDDILSLILTARYDDGGAMSDEAVHHQLFTLLSAGHETTATALAWALYWVHRNPSLYLGLRNELEALGSSAEPDAIAALPLLDATCSETLRLHPIVSDVARRLLAPLPLAGYTIPPGAGVAVATSLLHADPALYPRPDAFDASRFLDAKVSPFEYTPFGGGARRCLGAAFAMYEMKIVLATLLRDFELELVDRTVAPGRQNVTIGPRGGVRMRVLARRGS